MKNLVSLLFVLCLMLSGCFTSHRKGTKKVVITTTWDNKFVVDNPLVETVKAFKGTPTGNTGQGFQVRRQTSWTPENMPEHWR